MGPAGNVSSGGPGNRPMVRVDAELGWSRDDKGFIASTQPGSGMLLKLGGGEPFRGRLPVDRANSGTGNEGDSDAGVAPISARPEARRLVVGNVEPGVVPAQVQPRDEYSEDGGDSEDGEDSEGWIVPSSSPENLQARSRVNLQGSLAGPDEEGVRCMPSRSLSGVPFTSPASPLDSENEAGIQAPRVLHATRVTNKSVLSSEQFKKTFRSSQDKIKEIEASHYDNPEVKSNIFSPFKDLIDRITKRLDAYKTLSKSAGSNPAEEARLEKVLVRLMARVIELSEILNKHKSNLENVSFEGWHDGKSKKGRSHINAVVIRGNGDRIHLKTSVQKVYGDTPNYKMLDKIKMAENGEVCFEDQKAMPFHQRGGWTSRRDESLWVDPRSRSRTHDSNQGAGQIWGQVPEQASQAGVFEMPYSSQESRTRYENEIICSLERKAASDQTRFLGQARGTSGPSSGQLGMSGKVTTRVQGSAAFSSHQPSQTVAVSQPRDTQEGEGGPPRIVQSSLGGTGIQGRTPDSNQGAGRRWGEVPGQEIYSSLFESQAGVSGMPNSSQESGTGFGAATLSFLGMPGSHQIPVEGPVQARGASGHPSGQPGMSGRGGAQELQSAAFSSHQPSGTVPGYQPRDTKEGEDGTSRRDQSPWGVTGFRSRTPNSNQGADQSTAWGEDLGQEIYSTQVGSCTELYGPYSPQESGTGFGAASLSFLGIQDSHQIPVEGTVQAGGTSGLPSRQLGTSVMVSEHRSAFSPTTGSEGLPLRTCVDGGREDQGVYLQGASKHITFHSVTRLDFQPGHSLSNSCRSAHLAQQQGIHTSKTMCI